MQRTLNILWVLIICTILLTAAYLQYAYNMHPCPLCFVQRLSMIGIGICALLNLRFGITPAHYGFSLLFALLGRHLSLRLIPIGPPIFGYTLASWSAFVFCGSLLGAAFLMIFYKEYKPTWKYPEKGAFVLLVLATLISTITSL